METINNGEYTRLVGSCILKYDSFRELYTTHGKNMLVTKIYCGAATEQTLMTNYLTTDQSMVSINLFSDARVFYLLVR